LEVDSPGGRLIQFGSLPNRIGGIVIHCCVVSRKINWALVKELSKEDDNDMTLKRFNAMILFVLLLFRGFLFIRIYITLMIMLRHGWHRELLGIRETL